MVSKAREHCHAGQAGALATSRWHTSHTCPAETVQKARHIMAASQRPLSPHASARASQQQLLRPS